MKLLVSALCALAVSSVALGATVTQSASHAGYADHFIDYDDPAIPVGWGGSLPLDFFEASDGLTFVQRGADAPGVNDWLTAFGQPGNGSNQVGQNAELVFQFSGGTSNFATELWNGSGPGGPFGGGVHVWLDLDGDQNFETFGATITPAWNGGGDTWLDISAGPGETIYNILLMHGGFALGPVICDNTTWNDVPAPGALALLGLAGLARRRRR